MARPGIAPPFPSSLHVAIPAKQVAKGGLAELSVADRGLNEVLEFNKTYKSTGTISDSGPDGDWIDAKGNLYVTNYSRGNVTVNERVDIQAGGRLIGDVKASRLTIADGASFKGNVDMDV